MISKGLSGHLEKHLGESYGFPVRILAASEVSGGCINHAHRIETTAGNFFLKYNSSTRFPGIFEAEAKGLAILGKAGSISVPEVILTGVHEAFSFIVLEFIESGKAGSDYWEKAGKQIADMHKVTASNFGLDHNNYIGSIPQSNKIHADWFSFFLEERILAIGFDIVSPYRDKLEAALHKLIPVETPCLLHGDLWSGNIICGPDGSPYFIDPAVYFGHREMDLAMTRLFGGFSPQFYEAYQSEFPLQPGFEERVNLYNLYPLLVHVRIFGGSYIEQVKDILKRL